MTSEKTIEAPKAISLKDYCELIDTVAKVEYKRLSSSHLIEFSELVNIGTTTVHALISGSEENQYNKSYISTAIKWAIRNELRRRYKWYSLKSSKKDAKKEDKEELREAVYKTILSIDEMAEGDNPSHIKDNAQTPEESLEFVELRQGIKSAIKKLPQRERELIEARFFKEKKLREIAEEFQLSPSRISRIIQAGLNKVKKELGRQDLI